MKRKLKQLQSFLDTHQRFIMPTMLFGGMVLDFVTFKTLKTETAFSVLLIYLGLATLIVVYTNVYKAKKIKKTKFTTMVYTFAPLALQFFFGALLSASFVFYWFSGSLSVSWPLMFLLMALIIGNEKVRAYYLKPVIQFALYYFALFSILSVMFPFWLNSLSPLVFLLSGGISLIWMLLFLQVLSKRLDHLAWKYSQVRSIILSIFIGMNGLYFLQVIPPIPLSIRHAGVYHSISRSGADYRLEKEVTTLFEKIIPGEVIEKEPDSTISVFSSVFAPAELNTRIVHHWQYFDEVEGKWVSQLEASYSLIGGRQDGYRGFSTSIARREGRWRVDIQTERGQVLGRVKFRIKFVEEDPETEIVVQ